MNQQPTESSRLLRQRALSVPLPHGHWKKSRSCQHLCLPSKAAILIIFWTAFVGTLYNYVLLLAATIVDTTQISPDNSISANAYLPYTILAFVSMLYPLSGFIADVYCGRLKVVAVGLCFILTFLLLVCLSYIVAFAEIFFIHRLTVIFIKHKKMLLSL